jgi:hypothetical protein
MDPTPLEECSVIVESFVSGCEFDHEGLDEYCEGSSTSEPRLSPTVSSRGSSSATPTHQQSADALLVMQRRRAPLSQRRRLLEVFQYPLREIDAATQLLVLCRHSVVALLESLVGSTEAAAVTAAAPSTTTSTAATAIPGAQGEEFLQLGHRSERLELLGRRIQMLFVDKLIPSVAELEDMGETLRADVQQNLNPFGFPSSKDVDSSGAAVSPGKQHQQLPPTECPRDIDVVSESRLFSYLRIMSAVPHEGVAGSTIRSAMREFESTKVGPEGSSTGMEGQPFHGQMQEVRHVWKRLGSMLHEFSVMGRILRSAMAAQRRHRQTWIELLETGALDDLCDDTGETIDQPHGVDTGEESHPLPNAGHNTSTRGLLPDSLMRTATTRLQMRRLAMLVGTCRALDSSGAEAAIKKIHFEQERRQSAALATSMSATTTAANGRRGTSTVVMLASSASVSFPHDSSVSQVFDESTTRPSQSPTAGLDDAMDPFASVISMPVQRHQSRRNLRRGSAVPPMHPSLSIIPPTTLMDLEMIVRAYGLTVPRLALPESDVLSAPAQQQPRHQSTPSIASHLSGTEGEGGALGHPTNLGLELEQRLLERRQHRLDVLQKARRALEVSSASDASVLSRQRVLYATHRCDMGMMTTDCVVIQRCDVAAQTHTTGTVFEAATMDDVLGELNDARTALRERTQQLMLERHRSQALLSQLEKIQRQRQDHARRSAAAGSGTLGGAGAASATTPDDAAAELPMSPTRCLSPVNSMISDDEGTLLPHVVNSAVDLLLLRFREQKDRGLRRVPSSATTPSALERKASASRGARSNSPDRSPSPPLPRPHSSGGAVTDATSAIAPAGPMIKKFKILGRLDRADGQHRPESPHRQQTSPVSRPQSPLHVPTAASHHKHHPSHHNAKHATVIPLQPDDLIVSEGHHGAPLHSPQMHITPLTPDALLSPSIAVAAARSPPSAAKQSRPASSTLERQFGPIFARKLRSLEHHSNGLVGTVQEEDYWTGRREITSVVVPGGIDPRHGTKLVQKPGEGGGGIHHTMHLMQGPSAAALTRHALGPSQLKSTHYGTVGAGGRK